MFRTATGVIDFPRGDMTTYAHDLSCAYVIQATDGKVINVTFTQFNLEASPTCQYDWLQVNKALVKP